MVKCSKCKKRYAVVFVTKLEDGEKKTEGLCLQCARELGVPVDDIMGDQLKKFGISSDQLEELEQNMAELAESDALSPEFADDDNPALPNDGGAPSLNIQKIINEAFGNISGDNSSSDSEDNKSEKKKKIELPK